MFAIGIGAMPWLSANAAGPPASNHVCTIILKFNGLKRFPVAKFTWIKVSRAGTG